MPTLRSVVLWSPLFVTLACGDDKVTVAEVVPASKAECEAFYQRFAAASASGKSKAVADLFDWDTVVVTILGEAATRSSLPGFKRGLLGSIERPGNFVYHLARLQADGNTVKLLRVRSVDGMSRALVRHSGEQGVNYYDFLIGKSSDGAVRAVDVYIFLSGELMTRTVRRIVLPMLQHSKSVANRLLGRENLWIKHLEDIKAFSVAVGKGERERAHKLYRDLPDELQKQKNLLLMSLSALALMDDESQYLAAIETFRARYPGDACIDMISIDWYFLRENYDQALRCVRRVDQSVGGDPVLWAMAGMILIEQQEYAAAQLELDKAAAAEPGLEDIHTNRLNLALAQKDHAGTLAVLKHLHAEFDYSFDDLTGEEFADFVKSLWYAKWLEYRKAGK